MLPLEKSEYASFYQTYIDALLDNDKSIIENLEDSLVQFESSLNNISAEKQMYQYAENKWTVKEVVQHMIDTERVFAYRALRFARKDQTDLPGFDENLYVDNSEANQRDFKNLLDEFVAIRKATILLFQSFGDEILKYQGKASGSSMSVRAIGFIISGHLIHHLQVIKNRYL